MDCSYDTQTVPEMLFDTDTDNGITIEYEATQIAIVVVVTVVSTKCAITR